MHSSQEAVRDQSNASSVASHNIGEAPAITGANSHSNVANQNSTVIPVETPQTGHSTGLRLPTMTAAAPIQGITGSPSISGKGSAFRTVGTGPLAATTGHAVTTDRAKSTTQSNSSPQFKPTGNQKVEPATLFPHNEVEEETGVISKTGAIARAKAALDKQHSPPRKKRGVPKGTTITSAEELASNRMFQQQEERLKNIGETAAKK